MYISSFFAFLFVLLLSAFCIPLYSFMYINIFFSYHHIYHITINYSIEIRDRFKDFAIRRYRYDRTFWSFSRWPDVKSSRLITYFNYVYYVGSIKNRVKILPEVYTLPTSFLIIFLIYSFSLFPTQWVLLVYREK